MKKKISLLVFIISVTTGSFCFLAEEKNSVETLLFDNIEALAQKEGGDFYRCYGWGEIDCYGLKVEFMIDGMDLD